MLGEAEGAKEDLAGWRGFLAHLKDRGLKGIQLIILGACRGLIEAASEMYPEASMATVRRSFLPQCVLARAEQQDG